MIYSFAIERNNRIMAAIDVIPFLLGPRFGRRKGERMSRSRHTGAQMILAQAG